MQNYYKTVRVCLNTIARIISDNEPGLSVSVEKFQGRLGSSYFEDGFLKPLLRKHSHLFEECINEELDSVGVYDYRFVYIEALDNVDEASARTMEDVSLFIRRPSGVVSKEIINIKATNGNTADNVGGWVALDHMLYGPSDNYARTRNKVLEKIATTKINNTLNDYFLWVFYKNMSGGNAILESSSVHSLLSSSPDSFKINMSQNFPLQFNSSRAKILDLTQVQSIEELKSQFILKMLGKGMEFYKTQFDLWEKAAQALK